MKRVQKKKEYTMNDKNQKPTILILVIVMLMQTMTLGSLSWKIHRLQEQTAFFADMAIQETEARLASAREMAEQKQMILEQTESILDIIKHLESH